MTVTIKLFASFRDGRFTEQRRGYPDRTTIGQVVHSLKLPKAELGEILLNARHVDKDLVLHDGDTLSIFPLAEGGSSE